MTPSPGARSDKDKSVSPKQDKSEKEREDEEWDAAWLSWGTDIARRGAVEVLAAAKGIQLQKGASILELLAWKL